MNPDQIHTLLEGGYDLHMHPKPSHFPRSMDDFELIEDAARHGMAGIMLKSHYECTAGRAAIANRQLAHLPTRAYGGVALNWPVGGLNPYAVESALKLGACFVWMPTRDAENCLVYGDMPGDFFSRPPVKVTDAQGALLPAVYDIFDAVKKYNGILATGHISPTESRTLCLAGIDAGVRMVLTHPEWERTIVPVQVQLELAHKGIIIEKCWYNIADGTATATQMAQHIRRVGAAHCFMTTDRGQVGLERPVEGMIQFIQKLHREGIATQELKTMIKDVPAQLLEGF